MSASMESTERGAPDGHAPDAWEAIVNAVRAETAGGANGNKLAALIGEFLPSLLCSKSFVEYFRQWESKGCHVTPVHFYSPIPNTAELADEIWTKERAMDGIDMNDAAQLALVNAWRRFADEYSALPLDPTDSPERFYLRNPMFAGMDALVLYCMLRHFRPRQVIEVGCGFSTRLLVDATRRNGPTDILCIEPYPDPVLPNLSVKLLERRVQDVAPSEFERLGSGDFLFIDSSHTIKIGGDVNYLWLEVVPRLKPGVIVHLHDIFLPIEQPREWVVGGLRFWSEQDLLHAFLAFNGAFEVLCANTYLRLRHEALLRDVFPRADWLGGGSFWIRRVS